VPPRPTKIVSDVTPAGTVTVWLSIAPPPPAPPHWPDTTPVVHELPAAPPAPPDAPVTVTVSEVTPVGTENAQPAVPQLAVVKVWVGSAAALAWVSSVCAGDDGDAAMVRALAEPVVDGVLVAVVVDGVEGAG
jgi:hypothetical protein